MIGTGRVWATSASSAPSVTTISTSSRSATSITALANVRQRRFGSIPETMHEVALGVRRLARR